MEKFALHNFQYFLRTQIHAPSCPPIFLYNVMLLLSTMPVSRLWGWGVVMFVWLREGWGVNIQTQRQYKQKQDYSIKE